MNNSIIETRQRAAAIARSYFENRMTWQQFMDDTADFTKDSLIDVLVDLIEHEPKRGGFMGVNEKEWNGYRKAIQDLIKQLEQNE